VITTTLQLRFTPADDVVIICGVAGVVLFDESPSPVIAVPFDAEGVPAIVELFDAGVFPAIVELTGGAAVVAVCTVTVGLVSATVLEPTAQTIIETATRKLRVIFIFSIR
jgi:hypothetical protein